MKISKRRYYKLIHKFKYGKERGKNNMLKLLAKVAEKYAKLIVSIFYYNKDVSWLF